MGEFSTAEFPKVYWYEGQLWLDLADGRDYEVPDDPVKVLGFIEHFADKSWATGAWISDAIHRIAKERGWKIHPVYGSYRP